MFGCKIRVEFVTGTTTTGSPGPTSSTPPCQPGSNGGVGVTPRKARRDRGTVNSPRTCSASASKDSGIKLSSSDDNEAVTDDRRLPVTDCQPLNGDDIVVCGPVEEIDVETPTKDVVKTCDIPASCDAQATPSKKTKTKKAQCAAKSCKLLVFTILGCVHCILLMPATFY